MRYLTQHRQAFYFQIRVPAVLRPQYGALIRVHLQTGERDVARYRDLLLGDGLAPATVTKRVGFVSALLQAMYDAGRLPADVARGLRVPRAKVAAAGRRELRADELHALYASPIYASGKRPRGCGGEAAAWLPVPGRRIHRPSASAQNQNC